MVFIIIDRPYPLRYVLMIILFVIPGGYSFSPLKAWMLISLNALVYRTGTYCNTIHHFKNQQPTGLVYTPPFNGVVHDI